MTKLDDRTTANIEVALEKACRVFPNGGDHESRKYIAQKLELSAKKGNVTLGDWIPLRVARFRNCRKRNSA
jgi:hypothetical protein